jgi:TATA-binding protein-associated factor Taf7
MAAVTMILALIVLIFFSINGQPAKPVKKEEDDEDEEDQEEDDKIVEEDEPDDRSQTTEDSPLLSRATSRFASLRNSSYGTLEDANRGTSEILKTVSLTATGAIEV